MMLKKLDKRGQAGLSQLPGFFQIMLLVIIFAGLTFIVLDKFLGLGYDAGTTVNIVNQSTAKPTFVGITLTSARDASCGTITKIINGSGGITISSGNITQTGCVIKNTSSTVAYAPNWLITYSYTWSADTMASNAINQTTQDLYDYGIGFLGIIILVVMVYLIISIVSGRKSGAK